MKIIKNLFISKETKETLMLLNKIGAEVSDKYREKYFFEMESAWEIVSKEGEKTIYKSQKILTQNIRGKKIKPIEIILNLVNKISNNKLTTGEYHIYRGVLNNFGKAYYDIYKFTLKKSADLNFITKKQEISLIEDLDASINSVG